MVKKNKNFSKMVFWLPAVFWMGAIFYFSGQSDLSVGIGGPREYLMRKFAHISEFGILAVLFFIPLLSTTKFSKGVSFLFAFIVTVIFAFGDEFHQTFVLGRDGNLKDVLVDTLGALLFLQGVSFFFFKKRYLILLMSFVLNILLIWLLLLSMLQVVVQEELVQQKNILIEDVKETQEVTEGVEDSKFCEDKAFDINEYIEEESVEIPKEVLLEVPFSSQAPFGVWDSVHEEACEEMSLIMVKYYFDKKKLTPQLAEKEIQNFKEYQLKRNGHYIDSNMTELALMAKDYLKLQNAKVVKNVTKDEIIKALAQGSPVVVPTAGRLLGNPNFSGLGPLYHNLVIIGFKDGVFITNDPGTRNGKNYKYNFDTLMNAIHDFPGNKKEILTGEKNVIIFTE